MDKSVVKGLVDCLARPEQPLKDHLLGVAKAAGLSEGSVAEKLSFLAGLIHDAGKASPTWQNYLRCSVEDKYYRETLPHAYIGAALFAIYGRELSHQQETPVEVAQHYYLLVQDLQDHHGKLRNRIRQDQQIEVPWKASLQRYPPEDVFFADIDTLIHQFFSSLSLSVKNYSAFLEHLQPVTNDWRRLLKRQNRKLKNTVGILPAAYAPWICRNTTGKLIAADRLSASQLFDEDTLLTQENAQQALDTFHTHLESLYEESVERGQQQMADKRRHTQKACYVNYLKQPNAPWFTLDLPVGWGKTLTALRIALECAKKGQTQRIIYVAPYLAILSQAANDIREATNLEVLEHHHLALLNKSPKGDNVEDNEIREDIDVLTMESWRARIVATTFNQLFRAIFPRNAQQSIRITALENAFIIVDEPQIMDSSVYNAFLKGLDTLRERMNAQVMLVTATLPPTYHGLEHSPHQIAPIVENVNRYKLVTHKEPWTEAQLIEKTLKRLKQYKQVAVILNTIADAVRVFDKVSKCTDADVCLNLHGMMTPLHKAYQIRKIASRLEDNKPVLVVSTQVLEAGVNLSFRRILRARPILSSVFQAAGRANRHAEGDMAIVEVFDFVRESGIDVRKLIYKNEHQRHTTDEFLPHAHEWEEQDAASLIKQYFDRLSEVDAGKAVLNRFEDAAKGQWSRLATLSPFEAAGNDDDENSIEFNARVFTTTIKHEWMTDSVKTWMQYFNIAHIHDIYESYKDRRYMAKLSFSDRKRFLSLLSQFTAPLRWWFVPEVCGIKTIKEARDIAVLRSQNDSLYHLDTGYGHLLLRDKDEAEDFNKQLEAAMSRDYDPNFYD